MASKASAAQMILSTRGMSSPFFLWDSRCHHIVHDGRGLHPDSLDGGEVIQQLCACGGMSLDSPILILREPIRLFQDGIRNGHLTTVVQKGDVVQMPALFFGES